MYKQYKHRIIVMLVTALMLFAYTRPLLFLGFSLFIVIAWVLISKNLIPFFDNLNLDADEANRRNEALRIAKIYLSPYKSIWKNLKLSNKHCYLKLESDGVTIIGKEKVYPYRKFKVLTSHVHNYSDLWNMFCINFNHCKTYDDLIDDCRLYKLSVYEDVIKPQTQVTNSVKRELVNLLDINNCSEIELTALPGISIVMAKKAIKKREEISGFKTIEDFFLFMKLKSHIEKQLRDKICVKKMKSIPQKVERSIERSLDL